MMLSLIIDIFVDVLYTIDLYTLAGIHDCVDKLHNAVSSDPWYHWGISASSDLQLHFDIHDHIALPSILDLYSIEETYDHLYL